tara:strand:- start:1105 stop:1290 length:186 start_codon:yes stop_codon:yes gene_type:complete
MTINKKFVLRIYIVLAVSWSCWWLFRFGNVTDGIMDSTIIINSIIPIPLYFALRWILTALK